MNDEIELKPCPFCGSYDVEFKGSIFIPWVACNNCHVSTEMKSNQQDAANAWNERANA